MVKRYKRDYRGDFYEADDGPWVKYDHIAALFQEYEDLRLGYVDLLKSKAADSVLLQQIRDLRAAMTQACNVISAPGGEKRAGEVVRILTNAASRREG